MKLKRDFYLQEDVVQISKDLLGKVLITRIDGIMTAGMITETEAYAGHIDRASHAYGGRRTERTETMYSKGGVAYVYLCYGVHHLFNVVTNVKDVPHAVLVRAIEPLEGLEHMLRRRMKEKRGKGLASGPGTASQALGITTALNGTDLLGKKIWIEDRGIIINPKKIIAGPRIGVDYAGKDAFKPWRFLIKP